ncbi:chemotaxis protein CheW [Pseudolabrys taiwanensis]|uniref:Chemotaxis protein CheW n=1 Tax=Pseudolabrys taiwanensis TaxID=331696 RepID=A0A346A0K6_9HYPH|nr:chemotaxis protein CheW [Pseudolabrys taiwanensis]AXK82703.1 chemotaxis protein CheW [Pseudolabrys taiwanensis]
MHHGNSPTADAVARDGSHAGQLISFAIGDDQYGVDIMAVREIRGWVDITPLPEQPDYIRGVLDLRGTVVSIMDLRRRFNQGLTQATPMHIVIVVQIGEKPIGLLADRVLDIVSVDPEQLRPVPAVAQSARVSFLSGLISADDGMIAIIDLNNLLIEDADAGAPAVPAAA